MNYILRKALIDGEGWVCDDMGTWTYLGEPGKWYGGTFATAPPEVPVDPFAPPSVGPDLEPPYDDSKDHDPCPDCNRDGKGMTPGWYTPFVGPPIYCETCDGAGWV